MASRNQIAEVVGRRQVHRVRLRQVRAATKSGSAIRKARAPKKITDLDNEKGALVWTPDSKSLLYTAADKKLYSYSVADGKTAVVTSSDVGRIGSVSVSPDSKWVAFSKQDRTLRSHVYIAPIGGGEERHISDDSLLYSETNAVWTADGRYLVFTSAEGFEQRHRHAGRHRHDDGAVGAVAARSGSRSDEPRHRQRSAGPGGGSGGAAERRARRRRRRARAPVEVRIDWSGLARRARQLTVPGTAIGGLTPAPEGHSVALTVSTAGGRRRTRRRGAPTPAAGMYIINVESGQLTRVPPAPPATRRGGGGRGAAAPAAASAAAAAWCSRATAARCTSARAAASSRRRSPATRGRRRRRRPAAAAGAADAAAARRRRGGDAGAGGATPPRGR